MVVLTICNHKGGTGKTTSVINVAAALGLAGYRTLVVDLDPQAFLTRTLGIDSPGKDRSSLKLFEFGARLSEIATIPLRGFQFLPAVIDLTAAGRKLNRPTDVFWARESMIGGSGDYDVILFDTAAAVSVFSLNALVASTHVLIPTTPEYQPVVGADQTFQTCSLVRQKLNPSLDMPLLLLTQVDARKRMHSELRKYLREKYGEQVLSSIVRTSTSLTQTNRDGLTVFDRSLSSRGATDYANATDELIGRIGLARPFEGAAGDADSAPELSAPIAPDNLSYL